MDPRVRHRVFHHFGPGCDNLGGADTERGDAGQGELGGPAAASRGFDPEVMVGGPLDGLSLESAAMRISERVDNAVRAMAELAASDSSSAKAEAIATSQGISLKFLLDIFRDLKRAELVRSKRGPGGGFTLSRPPEEISLADVFRAVDGPLADVHDESLRNLRYDGSAAALAQVWMAIRGSLRRVLETVTLADLVAGDLPNDVADLAAEYRRTTAERHGQPH